ncbi:MAG TPA: ABC transporter permease, partial [Bryobacteraceae bacterium]|nr:ABC transporter permease [Bryobacteraceae bacterium]
SFPATLDYPPAKQTAEVNLVRRKLMALPGVTGVTLGRSPDGGGLRTAKILPAGRVIFYTFVLPNYFETLDIPLVAGHVFSVGGSDRLLVSQSAAKRLWPGEDPVGRTVTLDVSDQFHVEGEPTPASHPYVVAGVVGDTRGVLLDGSDSDKIYLSGSCAPSWAGSAGSIPSRLAAYRCSCWQSRCLPHFCRRGGRCVSNRWPHSAASELIVRDMENGQAHQKCTARHWRAIWKAMPLTAT